MGMFSSWSGFTGGLSDAWDNTADVATDAWESVSDGFDNLGEWLKNNSDINVQAGYTSSFDGPPSGYYGQGGGGYQPPTSSNPTTPDNSPYEHFRLSTVQWRNGISDKGATLEEINHAMGLYAAGQYEKAQEEIQNLSDKYESPIPDNVRLIVDHQLSLPENTPIQTGASTSTGVVDPVLSDIEQRADRNNRIDAALDRTPADYSTDYSFGALLDNYNMDRNQSGLLAEGNDSPIINFEIPDMYLFGTRDVSELLQSSGASLLGGDSGLMVDPELYPDFSSTYDTGIGTTKPFQYSFLDGSQEMTLDPNGTGTKDGFYYKVKPTYNPNKNKDNSDFGLGDLAQWNMITNPNFMGADWKRQKDLEQYDTIMKKMVGEKYQPITPEVAVKPAEETKPYETAQAALNDWTNYGAKKDAWLNWDNYA